MRKCKFNFGHTKWQDGFFHCWYETDGTLKVVFEDSASLVLYDMLASAVQIDFVEPPEETTLVLRMPNELKTAFVGLLEVVLSAHLYNSSDKELELDEKHVLDIIEAFVAANLTNA